jgi:hypothetical protein
VNENVVSWSLLLIITIVKKNIKKLEIEVKLINETLPPWISNRDIYILINDKKSAQVHFHSKRLHAITKINININMDSTAGSMNAARR